MPSVYTKIGLKCRDSTHPEIDKFDRENDNAALDRGVNLNNRMWLFSIRKNTMVFSVILFLLEKLYSFRGQNFSSARCK